MIPTIPHHCASGYGFVARRLAKSLFPLPVIACVMAVTSCKDEVTEQAPQVTVTDTRPVGEGLTVVGFALVGAAVVISLGRLLR